MARLAFATSPEKGPAFTIKRIVASLNEILSSQGFTPADLAGIGVSCGGPLDPVRGVIQSPPNLPTWKDIPICRVLEAEFQTPCYLENDANAGALAEAHFGAGRGANNLIFLTMGTGLGAGLILSGELQRGASHAAGEIGHVRLTRSGPQGYGKVGSVEGWASGGGMAQVARMYVRSALARGESTTLAGSAGEIPNAITARDVAEAAQGGDAVAMAVVRGVGEKLGEAMSILIDVINPECIVVGGLALRFGEDLLGPAREIVGREALRGSAESCRIVAAALGERIGDVAALCVAIRGLAHVGPARQISTLLQEGKPPAAAFAKPKMEKVASVEPEIGA
jgi:glucokinase